MAGGFVKLWRDDPAGLMAFLLARPYAWALLSVIALRARREPGVDPQTGTRLDVGQALVGDYRTIGASEAKYRAAKKHLEDVGAVSFRGTNRGTVATLMDSRFYDINAGGNDEPTTSRTTSRNGENPENATSRTTDRTTSRRPRKSIENSTAFTAGADNNNEQNNELDNERTTNRTTSRTTTNKKLLRSEERKEGFKKAYPASGCEAPSRTAEEEKPDAATQEEGVRQIRKIQDMLKGKVKVGEGGETTVSGPHPSCSPTVDLSEPRQGEETP